MKRDDASGERRGEDDGLLDGGGQLPESVHEHVDGLDELAQGPLPAFAELDHHALEAAAEVFQVSAQVVVLGGGLLGGVPGIGDLLGPVGDAVGAFVVEHVGGADRVGAEDGGERLVALCLCESAHLGLELAGQGFEADEVALGVVGADAELVHEVLRFFGGVGERDEHAFEAGAGVGSGHAGVGEAGEGADGLFHADAEAVGDHA